MNDEIETQTCCKSGDMVKPISVKILEWWFGLLAGVASFLPLLLAYGAVHEEKWDWELLLPAVGLCIGILFFWGLFLAVRRGQWASAEFPYWSLILFFLVPMSHSWRGLPESVGLIIFLGVMLVLAGVPSVCFHLRSSRLWFKERRGNRGPGYVGGCLTAGFILLLAAGAFLPVSHAGRRAALINRGQEVSRMLFENELARSQGDGWVNPNACSNSVEFLQKVRKTIRENDTGLPSFPEWTVVVNPPEGVECFPLLFTANVDVTAFPEMWDGEAGGDERLVLKPGTVVDSDKIALVVRSNGCAQILSGKYARRKSLFGPSPWKLTRQTYFLTPTGKVRWRSPSGTRRCFSGVSSRHGCFLCSDSGLADGRRTAGLSSSLCRSFSPWWVIGVVWWCGRMFVRHGR